MSKLFNRWIARLDAWEARVTDFPNYPGWLSVFAGVTFAVAGASLILALGFLILISLVPGLSALIQPLQPLGEVLAAIVAGLMILVNPHRPDHGARQLNRRAVVDWPQRKGEVTYAGTDVHPRI